MLDLATQHRPDGFAQEVASLLRTERIGRRLLHFDSVTSTNALAMTESARGAPEGTVVSADFQAAGRGRFGRRWHGLAGQNLMFSVVLRPPIAPDRYGIITVACGVAVAEAVETFIEPMRPMIKWPNDILLEGRKCCGMLLESAGSETGTRTPTVIIGIGLNVNELDFPADLEDTATSMRAIRGQVVPRAMLMAKLLNSLENRYFQAVSGDIESIIHAYEMRLSGKLRPVSLRMSESGAQFSGTLIGIDENGALVLDAGGRRMKFYAGEVTLRN